MDWTHMHCLEKNGSVSATHRSTLLHTLFVWTCILCWKRKGSFTWSTWEQREGNGSIYFISGTKSLRKGCHGFLTWVEQTEGLDNDPFAEHSAKVSVHVEVEGEQKRQVEALLLDYKDRFRERLPAQLPPFRAVNHEIDLEPGTPLSRPAYRLSKPELEELERPIEELLQQGFIHGQPSKSPYGAPVFFVKKKNGSFRQVCDWRQLDKVTIKSKVRLPNIEDLFNVVQGSHYFSKLDLASGYDQVRVRDEDVYNRGILGIVRMLLVNPPPPSLPPFPSATQKKWGNGSAIPRFYVYPR